MKSPWRLTLAAALLLVGFTVADHAVGSPRTWFESAWSCTRIAVIVGAAAAALVYLFLWVFEPKDKP